MVARTIIVLQIRCDITQMDNIYIVVGSRVNEIVFKIVKIILV